MKPGFLVINWSKGAVSGVTETEEEARDQLKKCLRNGDLANDSYILAEVKVLSEMRRVES